MGSFGVGDESSQEWEVVVFCAHCGRARGFGNGFVWRAIFLPGAIRSMAMRFRELTGWQAAMAPATGCDAGMAVAGVLGGAGLTFAGAGVCLGEAGIGEDLARGRCGEQGCGR